MSDQPIQPNDQRVESAAVLAFRYALAAEEARVALADGKTVRDAEFELLEAA